MARRPAVIVAVEGLTKRFRERRTWGETLRAPFAGRDRTVVDGVSFGVAEGEIFGLLGQNGAGKTTLFKMLAALIAPDGGRATVAGHDVASDGPAVRRALAPVLANERSLWWRLDARENLRLFAALQGLRGAAARTEADRVLAVTGLADAGAKMVGMFSTGMRQRLLIARALLARPRLLLLDEPTRSLDPISAREFRRFLRETVVGREGCAVLLATHDAEEVWELCDRVGVLDKGRLLAVDATARLRHRTEGDRHVAWVAVADEARVRARAAAAGVALMPAPAAPEEGWVALACDITGGADEGARVLSLLTADGARVARFERTPPTLADLIERVVRADGQVGSARGRDA